MNIHPTSGVAFLPRHLNAILFGKRRLVAHQLHPSHKYVSFKQQWCLNAFSGWVALWSYDYSPSLEGLSAAEFLSCSWVCLLAEAPRDSAGTHWPLLGLAELGSKLQARLQSVPPVSTAWICTMSFPLADAVQEEWRGTEHSLKAQLIFSSCIFGGVVGGFCKWLKPESMRWL